MPKPLEGSITKLAKNVYQARVQYLNASGERKDKKTKHLTRSLASDALVEMIARIEDEREAARLGMSVESIEVKTYRQLDKLYREKEVHKAVIIDGIKISGFKQSLAVINHYLDVLLARFGDLRVSAITFAAIREFKLSLFVTPTKDGNQRSVADVNQTLRRLSRILQFAVEARIIPSSPFKDGKGLIEASIENERDRILSAAEEVRLLSLLELKRYRAAHLKPIVLLGLDAMARRNEVLALRWEDVKFGFRSLQLRNKTRKKETFRTVPMTRRLETALTEWNAKQRNQTSGPVFKIADFKNSFHSLLADADITDFTFHSLRHTGITRLNNKNVPRVIGMGISGHTQEKTFRRYTHTGDQVVANVLELIDQPENNALALRDDAITRMRQIGIPETQIRQVFGDDTGKIKGTEPRTKTAT